MNPNYYSIIPADVRYSKDLCANAKLLYGEITALANKEGYCYASNQYFAELYDVAKGTISSWVSQLVKAGFVKIEIVNENERKIYLLDLIRPIPKKMGGDTIKDGTPCDKKNSPPKLKAEHINTVNNRTNNKENIPAHIQSFKIEEKKDPYFPIATLEETDMVLNVIQEHLDKHYKRVAVNKLQRREATQIYENLRDDDKEKQLRDMLNLYTFGEGSEKNKYWLDTTPQPRILYKAWDSLVNLRLPLWFEKGFGSMAEYEADLIKTKPSSHSSMHELKDKFFSGPGMSKEEADKALLELDELKETINGKNKLTA